MDMEREMRKMKAVSAVVLGLCLGTTALNAQITGNISATATVLSTITVANGSNLLFGNVTPGVNKTIDATGAGAGRFDVNAANSSPVSLTFTLPANLTGAGTMPIGTWTGLWNTTNSQSGGTAFTPSASATTATTAASGTTSLFVFVGATVSPGGAQAAGAYTGTVTMGVVYN
jgi:hypothetical protein